MKRRGKHLKTRETNPIRILESKDKNNYSSRDLRKGKRYKKTKKHINYKKVIFLILIIFLVQKILFTNNKGEEQKQEINEEQKISNIQETNEIKESQEVSNQESKVTEEIEFTEDLQIKNEISKVIEQNNLNQNNFSFFYYNIDTNTKYFYNQDKWFTAASTIKVPLAMLYYDKFEEGILTKDDTIKYTSDCYEAGNGSTAATYKVNQNVPISFLLKQSIVNSDNTAINILIKGVEGFSYRKQITKYTNQEVTDEFFKSNITSASYAFDVIKYLFDNKEKYSELIEYMKISSEGQYLKKYVQDFDVAHKYGSYNGYIHDYGIVFGKNTYFIGVFTKNVSGASELIAEISKNILDITLKEN